jgi:putative membrane protein insertion efficiency factor
MKPLAILAIRIYQVTLSPLLGPTCRFEPSCSRYAIACIEHHGVVRGLWLSMKRIARCHPWNPGGFDPPPLPPDAGEPNAHVAGTR